MSLTANIVLEKARNATNLGLSPSILTYASKYYEQPTFLQVIDELFKDNNIGQMLYASDCERLAIEPVIRNVEYICHTSNDFDIFDDDKARQTLGVIVKITMELYGYVLTDKSKKIINGCSKLIKTASVYTQA